eukprot:TRINITY_DN314_c0_g2_i1.p1 TRINITY_DN314_c0_g2~~TRINITY_DN314_c0_g2_i1.p1  ORF type:complete len:125 (+),score=3.77 TRINITY_DN314_c0_g2_i1:543-917(+)
MVCGSAEEWPQGLMGEVSKHRVRLSEHLKKVQKRATATTLKGKPATQKRSFRDHSDEGVQMGKMRSSHWFMAGADDTVCVKTVGRQEADRKEAASGIQADQASCTYHGRGPTHPDEGSEGWACR